MKRPGAVKRPGRLPSCGWGERTLLLLDDGQVDAVVGLDDHVPLADEHGVVHERVEPVLGGDPPSVTDDATDDGPVGDRQNRGIVPVILEVVLDRLRADHLPERHVFMTATGVENRPLFVQVATDRDVGVHREHHTDPHRQHRSGVEGAGGV